MWICLVYFQLKSLFPIETSLVRWNFTTMMMMTGIIPFSCKSHLLMTWEILLKCKTNAKSTPNYYSSATKRYTNNLQFTSLWIGEDTLKIWKQTLILIKVWGNWHGNSLVMSSSRNFPSWAKPSLGIPIFELKPSWLYVHQYEANFYQM